MHFTFGEMTVTDVSAITLTFQYGARCTGKGSVKGLSQSCFGENVEAASNIILYDQNAC